MKVKGKSKKVLILCHKDLIPPKNVKNVKKADLAEWRTEYYVSQALRRLGHEVEFCGLLNSLAPLKKQITKFKPDVVFNLLEEFDGERLLESFAVSFLERHKVRVTGVGSLGLILAKNKVAAKKILQSKKVQVPGDKKYPKIVKLLDEESSMGLSYKSVVKNGVEERRQRRILKSKYSSRIFTEEYIDGREIHVSVLSRGIDCRVGDIWETSFQPKTKVKIISEKVKWDFAYRDQAGISLVVAKNIDKATARKIKAAAIKSCRALEIKGHARIDVRLTQDQKVFVIEVNPNPDLAQGDEFAECFRSAGLEYDALINYIVSAAK